MILQQIYLRNVAANFIRMIEVLQKILQKKILWSLFSRHTVKLSARNHSNQALTIVITGLTYARDRRSAQVVCNR